MQSDANTAFIRVYFYKEPFEYIKRPLPKYRVDHIKTVDYLEQRYSSMIWRLLDTVVLRDFGVELNSLHPKKTETGRWIFDNYFISMSHSRGYYAIAISSEPIGIDVQKDVESLGLPFRWSKEEQDFFSDKITEKFVTFWTRKEALYKYLDPGIKFLGNEKKINTIPYNQFFRTWFYDGFSFMGVSICSDLIRRGEKYDFVFDTNLPEGIKEITISDLLIKST